MTTPARPGDDPTGDQRGLYVELVTGQLGEDLDEVEAWKSADAAARSARPVFVIGHGDRQTYVFRPGADLARFLAVVVPLALRFSWWTLTLKSGPLVQRRPDGWFRQPLPALANGTFVELGTLLTGAPPAPVTWRVTIDPGGGAPLLLDQAVEWVTAPDGINPDEYAAGRLTVLCAGAEPGVGPERLAPLAGQRLECLVRERGLLVGRAVRVLLRAVGDDRGEDDDGEDDRGEDDDGKPPVTEVTGGSDG